MAFAKIPMSFDDVRANYKKSTKEELPGEIVEQLRKWNEGIDEKNAEIDRYNREELPQINEDRKRAGEPPLKAKKRIGKNTPCCMQISVAFNGVGDLIPRNGAKSRDNLWLMGQYMILSVDELHDWFDWKFGRTETVSGPDDPAIKGKKKGVMIMGSTHVELYDGERCVQALAASFLEGSGSRPRWFWEFTGGEPDVLPAWLTGWWSVWDGNQYFYHFKGNGRVVYTKSWVKSRSAPPPKNPSNVGKVTISPEGKIVCSWAKVSGAPKPTIETFTRKDGGNSETEMAGPSNNYGWLTAKRLPDD